MYFCNKCGYSANVGPTHYRYGAVVCPYFASPSIDGEELPLDRVGDVLAQLLPEGYVASLHMERGSAWVTLTNADGDNIPLPDAADKSLYQQVNDALVVALRCHQPGDGCEKKTSKPR